MAADPLLELERSLTLRDTAPPPSHTGIARVRYTHDAMIDLIIKNPWISQNEIALHFGYSVGWISQIFCSDAFQARLAEKRIEVVNPELRATIEERIKALAVQSLAVLQEKLNRPASAIPDNLALRAAEFGAKALGLGAHSAPPAPPAGDRLTILADRLVVLQRNVKESINGESKRIQPGRGPESLDELSRGLHASGAQAGDQALPDEREPEEGAIRADGGDADEATREDGRRRIDG